MEFFEFDEPREVPASHLMECACCLCGARTLAAPACVRYARCASCASPGAGARLTLADVVPQRRSVPLRAAEPVSERVELRAPEFVCAPGCEHAKPGPVVDLLEHAWTRGWRVQARHSRGGVMGGNGKQLAGAVLWSVRFRRPKWMGYAVRRGSVWDSVCVAGEMLPPFLALGVTELREWLEQPKRGGDWYGAIRERRSAQRLSGKIVKCPGPGRCSWVDVDGGGHTHRADGDVKPKRPGSRAREHGG